MEKDFWKGFEHYNGLRVFHTILLLLVFCIFFLGYYDVIGDKSYFILFTIKDITVFLLCFYLWPGKLVRSKFSTINSCLFLIFWFFLFYVVWIYGTFWISVLYRLIAKNYNAHFGVFLEFIIGKGPINMMFDFIRFSPDFTGIFILAIGPQWMKLAIEEKLTNYKKENYNLNLELSFLQSQINPHFLFNTLNNIYLLLDIDVDKGKEMIVKLSSLMRYNVFVSKNEIIELSRELYFVEDFLSLMGIRYGNQVQIVSNIDNKPNNVHIIPLLIISFIENAFKHGPDKDPSNDYVLVDVNVISNEIRLLVENKFKNSNDDLFNASKENPYGGIGIANVRRRLELNYPGKYELEISKKGNIYAVEMKISLN